MSGWFNLGDIVAKEAPDHPAFVDLRDEASPRRWTTGELEEAANGFARGLLRAGHRTGERVAIISENRAEFLVAYLGTMRAGLVAVPINFKLPADTVDFIFQDAAIVAAVTDDDRAALVPRHVPHVSFDRTGDQGWDRFQDPGPWDAVHPAPGHLAKILYTSGSTGRPKGVPLPHRGQIWALEKFFGGYEAGRQEVALVVAPAYHKNGLFSSMAAVSNQMTIVSLPRFDARRYLRTVTEHRCTVLSGIPTMFALIARERDLLRQLDRSHVTRVSIGSAPFTDALLAEVQGIFPNAAITNSYGTTEAGPCPFGPHPGGVPRPPLSLGYPLADIEWRLTGGPSPDEGGFELRTIALTPGYLNLEHVTAERIHDGWYITGDLMRRDREGFFYFVGRADDMFVCGGENIYPAEVEKLLERHPDVAQAAVVPVPDHIKGQIPVAFVVPTPGATPTEESVKQFALERGPAYAHPRAVVFMETLPVAGTHKIDRHWLIGRAAELMRARGRG